MQNRRRTSCPASSNAEWTRARSRPPTPRCARRSKASWRRSRTRKDAAIRELSKKFDNWAPKDFRLTPAEIEKAIAQVAKRDLDDIKFAQAQVRNFAQKQRDTMKDLEVETLPGVVLGHRTSR